MVYYSHAAVGFLLMLLWFTFYNDHPSTVCTTTLKNVVYTVFIQVPYVSEVELEKIYRNKTKAHIEMDRFIPYKVVIFMHIKLFIHLN